MSCRSDSSSAAKSSCFQEQDASSNLEYRVVSSVQILIFQIFKRLDVIKCPSMKHEIYFTEQLEK